MKGSTTRHRIRDRWWTVSEMAREALITHAGMWDRIKRGLKGEELIKPTPPKAQTKAEAKVRAKLHDMARAKYKRTCPNCGCAYDIFQPAHILRTIKPG